MALKWPPKDPQEKLDYQINWSARLIDDQIMSSVWTVPTGLTMTADTFTVSTSTVWLQDGAAGETYEITNTITTTGGRIMEQSVKLKVAQK